MSKKITDTKIVEITGIPKSTLADWKLKDESDYRKMLYDMLKSMSEEELRERFILTSLNKSK